MRHEFGIPALTKSRFGKYQSYEVLTPDQQFVFDCQKKGLIEKVLLHNICFGLEIGKIIFN